MLRRDLLRSLLAIPLLVWLKPWLPRSFVRVDGHEANAATIYCWAIDGVKSLHSENSELLRRAATVAIDDPKLGHCSGKRVPP